MSLGGDTMENIAECVHCGYSWAFPMKREICSECGGDLCSNQCIDNHWTRCPERRHAERMKE